MSHLEDFVECLNLFQEKEEIHHVMDYTDSLWRVSNCDDGSKLVEYDLELYKGEFSASCGAYDVERIIKHKGYVIFNGDFGYLTNDEVCTIILDSNKMIFDHADHVDIEED